MAKNKKQNRKQPSQPERGQQQARPSSMEAQAEYRPTEVTPGDMARKGRQKNFGHN